MTNNQFPITNAAHWLPQSGAIGKWLLVIGNSLFDACFSLHCISAARRHKRGAAMMMVMIVLSLLLILAVSFAFLMSQQEGASVAALGHEQTRITTRTRSSAWGVSIF
jgi:hypothetical protein